MLTTSPSNAKDTGLIPGQAAKIPHALWSKTKHKKCQKRYCNKFSKDLKNYKNSFLSGLEVYRS